MKKKVSNLSIIVKSLAISVGIHILILVTIIAFNFITYQVAGLVGCSIEGDPFASIYCPHLPRSIESIFKSMSLFGYNVFFGGMLFAFSFPILPVLSISNLGFLLYRFKFKTTS